MTTTAPTADDVSALFDELAALVRAKAPLEPGLARLARDLPRGPGKLSESMFAQLAAGRSLSAAIDDPRLRIPAVFRAALQAGIVSGRLPHALESVALAARRMSDLRRTVGLSLIYPTILLCLGLLEVPLLLDVLAAMVRWMKIGRTEIPAWMTYLEGWSGARWAWWIAIPLVVLLLVMMASVLSGAGLLRGGWRTHVFRLLPWVRSAIDNARRAHFADQLALLVEHGVPLGDSLRIAAEAAVDPLLKRDALECADAVAQGQSLASICTRKGLLTPMLRWLMGGGAANQTLARSLRHAAETYQRRAVASADLAKLFLPGLLTAVIGGGIVALVALVVVWPWIYLWMHIIK